MAEYGCGWDDDRVDNCDYGNDYWDGYKSPVVMVQEKIQEDTEEVLANGIMRVIAKYNIDVDRSELLRALQYDRGQYDKGFLNGIKFLLDRVNQELDGRWANGGSSTEYVCKDGTVIETDVGYVYDWFKEYDNVIRREFELPKYEDRKAAD